MSLRNAGTVVTLPSDDDGSVLFPGEDAELLGHLGLTDDPAPNLGKLKSAAAHPQAPLTARYASG